MPKTTKSSNLLSMEPSTLSENLVEVQFESFEESSGRESRVSLTTNLTRVQSLVLDYKQFKAARTIQRYCRGWLARCHLKKMELSSIVIQKWWRRYAALRNLKNVAERALQLAIVTHYDRAAKIIQSYYRGWWSRNHVFDLTMLKTVQTNLAKELVHSLVKYLHSSKKNNELPGVYTIRDSQMCLKTLDQLMATFGYRYYNSQACYRMNKSLAQVEQARKIFKAASIFTDIPYPGFNDQGYCENRNFSIMNLSVTNPEHFELIHKFLAGQRKIDMPGAAQLEQKAALLAEENRIQIEKEKDNKRNNFLKRVFHEMKNWHHPNGDQILPSAIFKNTEMLYILFHAKKSLELIFGPLEPCVCPTKEDLSYLENR